MANIGHHTGSNQLDFFKRGGVIDAATFIH
jgi:hypothetical protein